jgi:hypothetical protein
LKQAEAAHTLLALLISLKFHWVDPQPGSEPLLGEPAKIPPETVTLIDGVAA